MLYWTLLCLNISCWPERHKQHAASTPLAHKTQNKPEWRTTGLPHRSLTLCPMLRPSQTLTLRNGAMTTGRRSAPVPQINCIGGDACHEYTPGAAHLLEPHDCLSCLHLTAWSLLFLTHNMRIQGSFSATTRARTATTCRWASRRGDEGEHFIFDPTTPFRFFTISSSLFNSSGSARRTWTTPTALARQRLSARATTIPRTPMCCAAAAGCV